MDNKTICPNFFNNVMNDSFGVYKTCCLHVPIKDNKVVGIGVNESLDTFWNSDYMKQSRIKAINGEEIKGCEECYRSERNGGTSLRKDLVEIYEENEDYLDSVKVAEENGGQLDKFPTAIELRVGNLCNLKCRMCQPQDSDLINKEYKELISLDSTLGEILPIVDFEITDDLTSYIQGIRDNASTIKIIRFSGGEPLINKSFYELLDYLIEGDYAKNIEFRLNTNLTKMKEETLEKLSKFKRVTIDFSIDGLGPVYEYIRYPMVWDITKNKIDMTYKFMVDHDNIKMNANFTVQIYNVFCMFDLIDFFLSKSVLPILHILQNPSYLNIRNMPDNLKNDLIVKIDETLGDIESREYPDVFQVDWVIERLIAIKNQLSLERNEYQIVLFKKFTNALDIKRNQNISVMIPEISKYYE
jgi:sulfatase maturation enzyme AslB (radical SAM superfamily)